MKKFNIILIILSIITFTSQAQKVILVPEEEIYIPSDNPWGLTYHDGWFWVSDAENGNIIKLDVRKRNFKKLNTLRIKHIKFVAVAYLFFVVKSAELIGLLKKR